MWVFCVCVVNLRWMVVMCWYGYKGVFEMVVIVDYLFGYDVIVGVMVDWMYEQFMQCYVLDVQNCMFMIEFNLWVLYGMVEWLLEVVGCGLWVQLVLEILDGLCQVLLEIEGDLEV